MLLTLHVHLNTYHMNATLAQKMGCNNNPLPPISRGCWSTQSRATRTSCCWGRPRGRSTSWPPRYPPSRRRATSRRSARHSHQKYLDCSKNICCSDPAAAAAAAGGDDPRAGAQRPGGGSKEPAETRPRHHQHQPLDQVLHISRAISIISTSIISTSVSGRTAASSSSTTLFWSRVWAGEAPRISSEQSPREWNMNNSLIFQGWIFCPAGARAAWTRCWRCVATSCGCISPCPMWTSARWPAQQYGDELTAHSQPALLQTKEDNLKKMMKEYGDVENDLKTVQHLCEFILVLANAVLKNL